jgi:hypothetical protein
VRHRLPAHRHREEHGVPLLGAGRHLRYAHGLPRPAVQRGGLLLGGRETARHHRRHPGAGEHHPSHDDGAQPRVIAPRRTRDGRHGARCPLRHDLRLPRSRTHPRHLRDGDRPAHEQRLHQARRRGTGSSGGCRGEDPRHREAAAQAAQGHDEPARRQQHLDGPYGRHRLPRPHRLHGTGHHRPGAPLNRAAARPAQVAAVLRVRELRLRAMSTAASSSG